MKALLQIFPRLNAVYAFYAFFGVGALMACVIAGSVVWVASGSAFESFTQTSTQIEAESSQRNLTHFISDRQNTLEQLASNQAFVASALGNSSAIESVEEYLSAYGLFADQRRVSLMSLTGELIVNRVWQTDADDGHSLKVFKAMAAPVIERNEAQAAVGHYVHEGRDLIVISVPVVFKGAIEGALVGEFEYVHALEAPNGEVAPSFVSIESWLDTVSEHKHQHPSGESWEIISARLPNTTLTLHYHRDVEDLNASKLSAVYQTIGSLVGGLVVAFGALSLLGSRLMLNPYKALQASRESLKKSNEALQYSAFHDALTDLANRRGLEAHLEELETDRWENGGGLTVMHLDLDRFKQINDTLGHAAGDHVLIEVAKILRQNVGPEDFVARIGGDEFVIVAPSASDVDALKARAHSIIEATRRPVPYEEHQCRFGASIGVACGEGATLNAKKLLVNADIALYRAKRQGRNAAVFFSQEDEAEVRQRKTLTDELRTALDRGEFFPVYQPQVDANTFEIVGVEALARWRHPTRGVLAPAAFLQVAEDLGVVAEIDECILECAMRDRVLFKEAGFERPKVSVNVSLRRLRDDQLLQKVKKLDFERGALVFELLESIFLDETDAVLQHNIDTLREMGVEIEIDDFGTGHASMMSLVRLGPDKLKIDRQFIQPLIDSPVSQRLVASMMEIAEALEIGVVAEGVETLEHAELLRDMGCDVLQGYALAKPMPSAQLVTWLRDGGATRLLSTPALSA